jgi:hypothetical protein
MGAQIVANLENNPFKAPVKIQSDVAKPSRYSDVIENYLASKNSEASKEQSQRRLGCQRVIEYCVDLLLTEYDQLHAYDLARGMHEDGFSHSMIKKMISYGGGLFKYCLKHRDALGRQLLKAHPWVSIELEEYGVPSRVTNAATSE